MPIIEDETVAFRETRVGELLGIKKILDSYKSIVLQSEGRSNRFFICIRRKKRN